MRTETDLVRNETEENQIRKAAGTDHIRNDTEKNPLEEERKPGQDRKPDQDRKERVQDRKETVQAWSFDIDKYLRSCRLCPRECGADRTGGEKGFCGAGKDIRVARAALHFWEEPCISGKAGSGAVFFSGCSLGCIYCQNAEISGSRFSLPDVSLADASLPDVSLTDVNLPKVYLSDEKEGRSEKGSEGKTRKNSRGELPGKTVSIHQLARIFIRLQNEQKACNINLVTAAHYIPQLAEALREAKALGLVLPIVYNSSGYEKTESLRLLEGLIDVYLPDYKYADPELARRYSYAPDYPGIAEKALEEMYRQTGPAVFQDGMIVRGMVVRHLLLPGHVKEAKAVVKKLYDRYGDNIYISLMNQYTPMKRLRGDALLGRRVTRREYERLINYAIETGVKNGYIQEGATAKESFIPSWNGEGVE